MDDFHDLIKEIRAMNTTENISANKTYCLQKALRSFAEERAEYYKQWLFEEPIVISNTQYQSAINLQKILHKLILYVVNNYEEVEDLMPVSAKVKRILKYSQRRQYQVGTYRTDYVYDAASKMRIIEITCRFAMNGVFLAATMNHIAEEFKIKNCADLNTENPYDSISKHLEMIRGTTNTIYVLKGNDIKNASKIYTDIYAKMGIQVIQINYTEIAQHLESMKDAWIISELALEEIIEIEDSVLEQLCTFNLFNDFRTVFLVHDKRFFSVIGNKSLQKKALTANEIKAFDSFYIPTYSQGSSEHIWTDAKVNKDKWILKHNTLGKSQQIFAGIVTSQEDWEALFDSEGIENMVLQEWIPQKTIKGTIKDEEYNDYVVGTLLYFDQYFFGFGDFRTSSFPVTNKKDHRKASHLILSNNNNKYIFKNYIQ